MYQAFSYRHLSTTDKNAQFFTTLFGGPEEEAENASSYPVLPHDAYIHGLLSGSIPSPVALRAWFTKDGRMNAKEETIAGRTCRWEYGYDDQGRLTDATLDGVLVESYAYDGQGLRVLQRTKAEGGGGLRCEYDATGRIVRAGDATYEWNDDGTLHSRKNPRGRTYFQYGDGGGLNRVLLSDGRELAFAHGPGGVPMAKYVNGRLAERWEWRDMLRIAAYEDLERGVRMHFHYAEGRLPAAMTMDRGQGPEAFALGYDQVGSLRAVADATGGLIKLMQYDSFGNVLHDTAPWLHLPIGFAGGAVDRDTDLVRFGRRDYDPHPGRFTAPDPLGYTGYDPDLYEYAVDDPVNVIDPTGEKGEKLPDGERHNESGAHWNIHDHYMPGCLAPGNGEAKPVNLLASPELTAGMAIAFAPHIGGIATAGNVLKQFGKQATKGIAKAAQKTTQAIHGAELKINEATWNAMEKGLQMSPAAVGRVLDPTTQKVTQPIVDFTTSALPGGPPENSFPSLMGLICGENKQTIHKTAATVLNDMKKFRQKRIQESKTRDQEIDKQYRERMRHE